MSNRRRGHRRGGRDSGVRLAVSGADRDVTRRKLVDASVADDVGELLVTGRAFIRNGRVDVEGDINAIIARHGARPVIDYMAGMAAWVIRDRLVPKRGLTTPAPVILEKHLEFLLATDLLRPYEAAVRGQMQAAMTGHPPPRVRPADASGVVMALLGLYLTTVIEAAGTRAALE